MGSHIDTVATGGAFDGTLGVLGGIEVMRALDDAGIETLRDVEVGFFTEEEGVRFGTDMLGSAVTAGRIPLDHAHKLTDADGKSVKEELERIEFDGSADERRPVPYAYIECHIEQGPILADAGVDVGIVEGVQSISWQRLTVRGEASHAGTSSTGPRSDTGGGLSRPAVSREGNVLQGACRERQSSSAAGPLAPIPWPPVGRAGVRCALGHRLAARKPSATRRCLVLPEGRSA
jgi:hydantoinase/carbamoylase family amidase